MSWDPLTVVAVASMVSAAVMVMVAALDSLRHVAPWRLGPLSR